MLQNLLFLNVCFALVLVSLSVPIGDEANQQQLVKTIQSLIENERLTKEERKTLMAQQILENFEKNKIETNLDKNTLVFSAEEKELFKKNQEIIFNSAEKVDVHHSSVEQEANERDVEWNNYLLKKIGTPVQISTEVSIEKAMVQPENGHFDIRNAEIAQNNLSELCSVFRYLDNLLETKHFENLHRLLSNSLVQDVKVSLIKLIYSENSKHLKERIRGTPIGIKAEKAINDAKYFLLNLGRETVQMINKVYHLK